MAEHVWNLRSERSYRVIDAALRGARGAIGFRVVHFTVLGNHLHLVVEADGPGLLASAMRGISIRLARGLNRMMGREGPVLEDRYHAHVLRTPAEVRNAVRYVLGNFDSHAARRGERVSTKPRIDPFSSASGKQPRAEQPALFPEPATSDANGWLLRNAERVRPRRRPA
jgi:REP element-mobilizing transposase RayT